MNVSSVYEWDKAVRSLSAVWIKIPDDCCILEDLVCIWFECAAESSMNAQYQFLSWSGCEYGSWK